MMIWSALSIFGLYVVHRTLGICEEQQMLSQNQMIQVRMISFLTVVVLNFLFKGTIVLLIGVSVTIFLSPWWVPYIIQKHRESQLKNQFLPLLDHLILSMKTGKGFRPSLAQYIERNPPSVRFILQEFLSALQYQKEMNSISSDTKIQFYFRELHVVDQSGHKPVDRLRALRRRLMMEKTFRQKSRQALLQVRFQSWIISGMYFLILAYVQHDFGLRHHLKLVAVSGVLFLSGLIWVQRMGRSYQWKI
jgi:Flp pilus assembly protein TadB